ncbi:MAG: LysM peptidoglycan-binding domain-containing protein [Flavobacteriales bacterium]|nr:LysM peptidoglycan-binding domain-containing protein [Flavobacteriales bacterium]
MGKIAEKYKVPVKQLKKWNNLKSDKISKGKKLKIIRTKTVKVEQPKTDIKPAEEKPHQKDTIANAPHVEVIQPVSNPLEDQIEKLEQQATACIKKKDFNGAIAQYQAIIDLGGDKDTYEKKIAKAYRDKKSSDQGEKKVTYTVKSGDSLWTIARKYPGVTEKDIMKWNKCSENIKPGQKLIIYTKPGSKSK